MPRPDRTELIKRFFPELGRTGTAGDTEAAIEVNTRACEAILADIIKLFDEFRSALGDGALVIKLADGDRQSHYVTIEDLCVDLVSAESADDQQASLLLRDTIRAAKTHNFDAAVLVMLIDNTSIHVLPLPREYPAGGIKELQHSLAV
jgi:hypothetical protein